MGVAGYLDRWDPAVDGDSAELEMHIRSVIRCTPSILAVVTENTPLSWWVPFEIGVARETNSQIATFLRVDMASGKRVLLPSYLETWPIPVSGAELTIWARAFLRLMQAPLEFGSGYIEKAMCDEFANVREIDNLVAQGKVRFF